MARGIHPQILYEPADTVTHDIFLPEGTSIQATPLGPAAAALTFSLLPTAWVLTVTEPRGPRPETRRTSTSVKETAS